MSNECSARPANLPRRKFELGLEGSYCCKEEVKDLQYERPVGQRYHCDVTLSQIQQSSWILAHVCTGEMLFQAHLNPQKGQLHGLIGAFYQLV